MSFSRHKSVILLKPVTPDPVRLSKQASRMAFAAQRLLKEYDRDPQIPLVTVTRSGPDAGHHWLQR